MDGTRRRDARLGGFLTAAVVVLGAFGGASARAADPAPAACTDPGSGLLAECLPDGTLGQLHRQGCAYLWVEDLCAATAWPDPGYSTDGDPSADEPFVLLVGAVHEHSSYSDGDPTAIPRDYFESARTGHNVEPDGSDSGVRIDFVWSSEHSDNVQIPVTTSAACLDPVGWAACSHAGESSHYWKWPATLEQAVAATDETFTAIRGFEWTNDYFNHMNVYFSTNFTNVKIDGSYASMDVMWDWLREPVEQGGGADALVTFNHPGGDPALTPFDGSFPHNQLLAEHAGGANWNDVAYVPDVDDRVAGIEVNGGDDIEWYVRALTNGWHLGPVAAEDEHGRAWSSSAEGKTLLLARANRPRDHYFAFQQHRTIAVLDPLIGGEPGERATFPAIAFYADGTSVQDAATVLGGTATGGGEHDLRFDASGLPPGSRVALVSSTGGQAAPIQLGEAGADGSVSATRGVTSPAEGEDWYFAVVCLPGGTTPCGSDQDYAAVTAPIWFAA